jgi:dTDP-4-dehydrorhamnose 3,5-epimerase
VKVQETRFPGVRLIETRAFHDARGHFLELWNRRRYAEAGLAATFVQDNVSVSRRGVIRGLHYQHPHGQGKLVSVLDGEVWDVVVDVRRGSPTKGEWYAAVLSAENGVQIYVPGEFAHGFAVLSERAVVCYKCTEIYDSEAEQTILWNDPELGIEWPVEDPVLSEKDAGGVRLRDVPAERLPPG